MTRPDDTIVAVSSPPGRSARGLVRISGPEMMSILGSLLEPPPSSIDQLQTWPAPRRLVTSRIQLPMESNTSKVHAPMLSLPVLLSLFLAPRSYTAQNMAEIQCPGNPVLLERLVRRVIELGARIAEPGEFTYRAFLAGKMDLTEAEGVAATIAAVSDSQLQAAHLLRRGELGRFAASLVDDLAKLLALVEAGIDFVDQEDVVPIPPRRLSQELTKILDRLDQLLAQSRSWGTIEALPRVVFVGAPSSGKSTLFNTLLGRHRSVISSTPGTTRDVLTEPLALQSSHGQRVEVMLVDIAGLDTPETALDHDIQAAAHRAIEQADLILQIHAPPEALQATQSPEAFATGRSKSVLTGHDDSWPDAVPPRCPVLRIHSKADLLEPVRLESAANDDWDLIVSAHSGVGIPELRQAILTQIGDRAVTITGEILALEPRHEEALYQARQGLQEARELVKTQYDQHAIDHVELVATTMRQSLDALEALGGRVSPDDVIGRIFATFCVGK